MTSLLPPRWTDGCLDDAGLPPARETWCWWWVEYGGERRGCKNTAAYQIAGLSLCMPHTHAMRRAIAKNSQGSHCGWFRKLLQEYLADHDEDRDIALSTPVAGSPTVIYFVARYHLVKIGYTADLRSRLRAIEQGSGIIPGMAATDIELLASFPAGPAREEALHLRFRHLRAGGEWFLLNSELRDFIERVEA